MNQLDARRAARQQLVSEDAFDTQAQALARGMWFRGGGGRQPPGALPPGFSPMRTRLLFTNREGVDAFVRSSAEGPPCCAWAACACSTRTPSGRALDKVLADSQEALAA